MTKLKITKCPICASKRIHRVRRDIKGTFKGKPYLAKSVDFEECPACGERLFDLEAMRKLEVARDHAAGRRKRVA